MDIPQRVSHLERTSEKSSAQLTALEKDVAVIRSSHATKEDLTKLEALMHKEFTAQTWRIVGAMLTFGTALTAAVFFIARHVK
ncbi:hypothetical protein [Hydrogenophaga sp.]|uniref:hypothetical protein n=1 Tax=Hydrogenophaga sp. TaxID=1904254 RepID=UPI0027342B22|nr:hypothetical protein [Hydrogenophaga sp.]MDP3123783.1 hypothetical protein [Thiobacillus sp.]MDP3887856.1 hypothetical protein [Hydrogenophaga sp.]MDZ4126414.1 hypothetical protein [Hydrogenophaga sp.]